jgi:DNA primase
VSAAQPYIQKVTAPILRIQLINAVAEIGKISQDELRQLLKLPESPRFRRPAQARTSAPIVNRTHEWSLLSSVLTDLTMFVHIDPALLREPQPETQALLAIRDVCQSSAEDLTFRALLDGLEGHESVDLVLKANRHSEELGFSQEEARGEIQWALTRLDVIRREKELESMRATGLRSREARVEYQGKLNEYNLLRGAVRGDVPVH